MSSIFRIMNRILKAIKNYSESLRDFWVFLGVILIKIINTLHHWMMENPKNTTPFKGVNMILMGVNGIVFSELIMPKTLIDLMDITWAGNKLVIPIMVLTMSFLTWCILRILEIITEKNLEMPVKYEFLILSLSVPALILVDKFLSWIKVSKNYDKQNNISN